MGVELVNLLIRVMIDPGPGPDIVWVNGVLILFCLQIGSG